MPKVKISEFDTVAANNTDIDGINLAEGMLPSDVNNAIRELMSQLKDFQAGTVGDSFNGPIGTSTAAAGSFTTIGATGDVSIADKIIHTGDTNTAIRFPAADTITAETSGVERLRIDTSGNVGIDTATPGTTTSPGKLAVISTGVGVAVTTSTESGAGYHFATYNSNTPTPSLQYFVANSGGDVNLGNARGALKFYANDTTTERMRIDSSGNVLVGTTTALVTATDRRNVTINGAGSAILSFGISGSNSGYLFSSPTTLEVAAAGSRIITFVNNSAERMRIDVDGFVCVGTSTALVSNSGRGNITLNGANDAIFAFGIGGTNSAYIYNSSGALEINAVGSRIISFVNNGSERMRIDSSGNVLVGTTSTAGSTSNNAMIVGGILKTISGSVSAASGSATTLYTAPYLANGTYIVSAGVNNTGEPAAYSAVSLISVDSTVIVATALKTATNMTISVSGQNVRATQASGITANIVWTATRVH